MCTLFPVVKVSSSTSFFLLLQLYLKKFFSFYLLTDFCNLLLSVIFSLFLSSTAICLFHCIPSSTSLSVPSDSSPTQFYFPLIPILPTTIFLRILSYLPLFSLKSFPTYLIFPWSLVFTVLASLFPWASPLLSSSANNHLSSFLTCLEPSSSTKFALFSLWALSLFLCVVSILILHDLLFSILNGFSSLPNNLLPPLPPPPPPPPAGVPC